MLIFAITTATALLATQHAPVSPDRMSGPVAHLVGNTIQVRYGDQMMVSHFAPDGTFRMRLPDGVETRGDWVADDRNMCWITRQPQTPPGENVRCERVVPGKRIGDTWTQIDTYGDEATVTLVAGDQVGGR